MCSTASFARSAKPEILPIQLHITPDGLTHIAYRLPCDAKEIGYFLNPMTKGGKVKLGVMVERSNGRCAKTPNWKTQLLPPSFAHLKPADVISFNPAVEPRRYRLISPQLVTSTPRSARAAEISRRHLLQIVYQTRCGPKMGVMLGFTQPAPAIAMVESQAAKLLDCQDRSLQLAEIKGIPLWDSPRRWQPSAAIAAKRDESKLPYRLRLRPIKPDSLRQQGELVSFHYQRACHEAPVGLVTRRKADKTLVAMLVARYPRSICPAGVHPMMWTRYQSRVLASSRFERIEVAKVRRQPPLQLLRPISVAQKGSQLKVEGFGHPCRRSPLAVYAEHNRQLYFGLLTAGTPGKTCKKELAELSFVQKKDPNLRHRQSIRALKLSAF